ncbi:M-phase inducer phosphatase [Orchesella cincta]|uniref:protein-tyrosine-phosphatase n=1 Tax=Orchesella cincta TaxID=48709 RepID=A0A1D2MXG3_ORCCI|nr:M-phase inducer phosphatase [Orchesella cincta]
MDGKQDAAIKEDNAKPDNSIAQHPTPPSSSFTAFKLKTYNELRVDENNLPSSSIAELWQKPFHNSFASSKTPKARLKGRLHQNSSSRRNLLPPTKLSFDNMDSSESPTSNVGKTGIRRSSSYPESGTSCNSNFGSPSQNAKRLKTHDENSPADTNPSPNENSPYNDLVGSDSSQNSTKTSTSLTPVVRNLFLGKKSHSDSGLSSCNIKTALEKIESNPNLIGDGTRSHQLPVKTDGKHRDLKEIDGETLADLIARKDAGENLNFRIIDCRYPYEYIGGHIKGAVNLYTKNQVYMELLEQKTSSTCSSSCSKENEDPSATEILIYHCEFSSKRAPSLCHYVRNVDRAVNSYPNLYYPEMYVLHGGYQEFFLKFDHLCDPQNYIRMDDPKYAEEYRKFKSESKLGTKSKDDQLVFK